MVILAIILAKDPLVACNIVLEHKLVVITKRKRRNFEIDGIEEIWKIYFT